MDGIIHKKNTQKKEDSIHDNVVSDFVVDEDRVGYRIFELGRSYAKEEEYRKRFDDVRDKIDVRALLTDEKRLSYTQGSSANGSEYEDCELDTQVSAENSNTYGFHDEKQFVDDERSTNAVDEWDDTENEDHVRFFLKDMPVFRHESVLHAPHVLHRFAFFGAFFIFIVSFGLFIGTALAVKDRVMHASERAITSMQSALASIGESDLDALRINIDAAHQEFVYASEELSKINPVVKFTSRFVPGASKISSGDHIIEAGEHLSHTASAFGAVLPSLTEEKKKAEQTQAENISFLRIYRIFAEYMSIARHDVARAQEHIDKVYIDDIPEEYRDSFVHVKELLPEIGEALHTATTAQPAIEDLLGANGPRTYLLLFQNNHEMRATGGFIGSYGIVKINKGRIDNMFVDDIYNPDGQLIDRVVPPLPIQKISANWSLHDSNWFVDFPTSAQKAMDFYERTGGPSVDGVIAITPAMMEKLLQITGPVTVEEQGVVLTHENFMEVMQNEIEDRANYTEAEHDTVRTKESDDEMDSEAKEKKEKKKKALSSLMPIMIERISTKKDPQEMMKFVSAISEGVQERHIVMYTKNAVIQKIIANVGWSGEVLHVDKDYVSVINTNINGFKTDGVITEVIDHTATIDKDGYIVDTVKITRTHEGGHTGYPWWDAVNADYMRVYVPEGSQLISAEGHTREINEERLDYDALGYERDADVVREESQITIDEETGTRIYNEYGKTVFANWVYVSPQESVTVTYTYRLPFRVDFYEDQKGRFGSYAIVFQKQSGSENTSVKSRIVLDDAFEYFWHTHDNTALTMEKDLLIDRYNGAVFTVK